MGELREGQAVRILADNPVFHLRKGRIYKKAGDTYQVRFDGDGRVMGPFFEHELALVQDGEQAHGENQEQFLLREYAPDFGCWTEEALRAYSLAEKAFLAQKRKK